MCYSPKFILAPETDLKILPGWQRFMSVPCGKCDECRVNKSKEWAVRCLAEFQALSYAEQLKCWFITFTYDDLHNPVVLQPDDMTLFWKRLRKHFKGCMIKYFYCGEYGTRTYRPHYHAIVYGLPLSDLKLIKHNSFGDSIFDSEILSTIWGKGMIAVGSLSLKSCSYVARYTLKKNNTDCFQRVSQGFGKNFLNKYMFDIIQNGFLTLGIGSKILKANLPRYFCKKIREYFDDDKVYSDWLKNRQFYFNNNEKRLDKFFNANSDKTWRQIYLGKDSDAVSINHNNKKLLNQALYDLYKCRENF